MEDPKKDVELNTVGTDSDKETEDDGQSYDNYDSNYNSSVYDTKHQKSLRHYLTREALPKESHYRDLDSLVGRGSVRPTLDDLHDNTYRGEGKGASDQNAAEEGGSGMVKLGWIKGVFVSCLLNIWSVMLFLRVPWVISQAGIVQGICIITLANLVTLITTLSMSAVATNGKIKGGGIYYMISRSLGPQFGASIGLMFTVAISIATAVHAIGFVNALQGMLLDYFQIPEIIPGMGGGINEVRLLSVVTCILMLIPAIVGMEWVMKVQIGFLFLIVAAQFDFISGAFAGPSGSEEVSKGFIGLSKYVFNQNVKSDYRYYLGKQQSFFSVFAVFFPAVTGIVAGANLSGDLKDPSSAIPKGTLGAIGVTFTSYISYALLIGATTVRFAFGDASVFESLEESIFPNHTLQNPIFGEEYCPFDANGQSTCLFGSQNDFNIMEIAAAWGPLIYIGCFAASLSSVIACLVGSPRILQALAKDKLYPLIHVFAKGHGPSDNPLRGYVMVFALTFCCLMIGDLNAVSGLLTNFSLSAYGLVNFSCFHASLVKSPGWRPSFKYFNLWVSLVGGLMCLAVMFLIDWMIAFCTLLVITFLYFYVSYRKPDVNWGSSTQAQTYVSALKTTLELVYVEDHVKNYRPQILLMSGNPGARPSLVDFAYSLTKNVSLLTCANVVKGPLNPKILSGMNKQAYTWMSKHNIKSFYSAVEADDIETGSKYLYQLVGLGKMRPNMVFLGYKADWQKCDRAELKSYFSTLHKALDMHFGLAILRVPEGLDFSNILDQDDFQLSAKSNEVLTSALPATFENGGIPQNQSVNSFSQLGDPDSCPDSPNISAGESTVKKQKHTPATLFKGVGGTELSKDILNNITRFRQKQKKGTIDVWWLYDDGGLTLLLPYILSTRSNWSSCKLRVFALANRKDQLEMEQRSMANLLGKFRIDYSDVIILHDVVRKADEAALNKFDKLIKEFKTEEEVISREDFGILIGEEELQRQKEKTNRHIRLREQLLANSKDSSLIVMTLPMPRKSSVSATLYMAWLETLTKDMPPFMLIRGNQTSVLTFYS